MTTVSTVRQVHDHKYTFGEDEVGLFEFDEPLDLDEEPIPKTNISLNGVKVRPRTSQHTIGQTLLSAICFIIIINEINYVPLNCLYSPKCVSLLSRI